MKTRIKLFLLCFVLAFAGRAMAEPVQLNITGEERFRPEMRENKDFNSAKEDGQAYIGQRVRLNFDIKTESGVKAFISVQDARTWGDVANTESAANTSTSYSTTPTTGAATYASRGSDRQSLDIYQAWFMLENLGGAPIDFKIGRQQLVYGDQRLLGHLGWVDAGRAFDAYKVIARLDIVQLDVFLAKLKETAGTPSTSYNDDDLYGLYSMWPVGDANKLDVYYLVWKTDSTTYGRNINTYGARFAGKAVGFDYTAEMALQSGKWTSTVDQSASAIALTGGYTFTDVLGGLRVGAEYDMGSGDGDATDTTHKDFVFPFHTNHMHYGYMDYFSWGNMSDIAVKAKAKPGNGPVTAEIALHKFALAEAAGSWLNVAGTGTTIGGTSSSTDAGTEIDLTAIYAYNPAVKITAGYSIFAPGQAAKDRSGGSDASTWGYAMFEFAF